MDYNRVIVSGKVINNTIKKNHTQNERYVTSVDKNIIFNRYEYSFQISNNIIRQRKNIDMQGGLNINEQKNIFNIILVTNMPEESLENILNNSNNASLKLRVFGSLIYKADSNKKTPSGYEILNCFIASRKIEIEEENSDKKISDLNFVSLIARTGHDIIQKETKNGIKFQILSVANSVFAADHVGEEYSANYRDDNSNKSFWHKITIFKNRVPEIVKGCELLIEGCLEQFNVVSNEDQQKSYTLTRVLVNNEGKIRIIKRPRNMMNNNYDNNENFEMNKNNDSYDDVIQNNYPNSDDSNESAI